MTTKGRTATEKRTPGAASVKIGTCLLNLDVTRIMGIVNNTPDSFSGDGIGGDTNAAVRRGVAMFRDGADIVDVGGESTRPGADPVPAEVELARTIPIVEALNDARQGRVSIDTMKPEVAEAALFAGATIVNDVSGLRNKRMIRVVAEHDASVIIMHMLGEPSTMQANPRYKDVVGEIKDYLHGKIGEAEKAGISPSKIMVDPGIGFGKTLEHNLEILARLRELKALGKPIVIGVSRKAFIGKVTGAEAHLRVSGSVVAAVLAAKEGAAIVRVHDVAETAQALKVWKAIESASKSSA